MQYWSSRQAVFLARPNRFIAHVELDGELVVCHVKNTGRCRELLIPGTTVYLNKSGNPARKTNYDLIAVKKGDRLINLDAQAPNRVFEEWARGGHFLQGLTQLKPETVFGNSRFDFYWETAEKRGFVEVKGVTLEQDGMTYFPDAPTLRGVKHLEGLIDARHAGYDACVFFVIQMADVNGFAPNDVTHPAFGEALRRAAEEGVAVCAHCCCVTRDSLTMDAAVPIKL